MGELDALEDDLAAEATTSGSVPAYLQVRRGVACAGLAWGRVAVVASVWLGLWPWSIAHSPGCLCLLPLPPQDVDLPEVPQGQPQQQAQPQAADEFGLPAIPQRT